MSQTCQLGESTRMLGKKTYFWALYSSKISLLGRGLRIWIFSKHSKDSSGEKHLLEVSSFYKVASDENFSSLTMSYHLLTWSRSEQMCDSKTRIFYTHCLDEFVHNMSYFRAGIPIVKFNFGKISLPENFLFLHVSLIL